MEGRRSCTLHSHSVGSRSIVTRAPRCVTRPRERGLSPVGVGRSLSRSLGHALLLRRWAVDHSYLVEDRERCMERCRVDRRVESSLTNTYVMYRQSNAAIIFILPRPGRARTHKLDELAVRWNPSASLFSNHFMC